MPRKKALSNEHAAAPSTRTTRQSRSRTDAEQKTPHNVETEKPKGSYQPSALPRRHAPARPRAQSIESMPWDDFQQSSNDMTDRVSPAKDPELSSVLEDDKLSNEEELVKEEDEDALQEIIDFTLPDLGTWTGRMYDHVVKSEDAAADQLSWNRLALIEKKFNENREKIVPTDKYFINPTEMHDSVADIQDTEHLGFAAQIVVTANTALLLKLILQISHGKELVQPVLEELDEVFPAIFKPISDTTDVNQDLSDYDKAFRTRCCILAHDINEHGDISPAVLATKLFCLDKNTRQVKKAKEILVKGPYEPVGTFNLEDSEELAAEHIQNMEKLSDRLSQRNRSDVLKVLQDAYPADDLLRDLRQWAHQNYKNLHESSVDRKDNVLEVASSPTQSAPEAGKSSTSSANPPKSELQLVAEKQNKEHNRSANSEEQLFVDENQSVSDSDSDSDEPVIRTGERTGSLLDGTASLDPNSIILGDQPRATPPSNQQASTNPLATLSTDEIIRNYRAGGVVGSSSGVQAGSSRGHPIGRKRPAVDDEDERDNVASNSDADFEVDNRPPNEARRMTDARQSARPSHKRTQISESHAASVSGDRRSVSLSARSHQTTQDLQPSDIVILTQKARVASREYRQPKLPQRRQPWRDDDTAALIHAIPRYLCAWSEMEHAGLFSVFRTQQQIRDKARNIKVEFLKSDDPLPAGFDGVALGKKEIDAVRLLGKNPMRKEDDIDRDGNVINNIWEHRLDSEDRD